jgi:uncharacterized membrane protein (UPF0127 family)
MPAHSLALVNQRTDEAVAERVEVAVTRRARRKGLLGRTAFDGSRALVLAPCVAVHTMFMRFPIDVVFVDAEGRALRTIPNLAPWRMAIDPFAHAVVEMPAGSLAQRHVKIGDRLYLLKDGGDRVLLSASDMRERAC